MPARKQSEPPSKSSGVLGERIADLCFVRRSRGAFDVYLGAFYIGSGDAYDLACTSNCQSALIFSHTLDINTDYSGGILTVRNRNIDQRLGVTPVLDLNYVKFRPYNC